MIRTKSAPTGAQHLADRAANAGVGLAHTFPDLRVAGGHFYVGS